MRPKVPKHPVLRCTKVRRSDSPLLQVVGPLRSEDTRPSFQEACHVISNRLIEFMQVRREVTISHAGKHVTTPSESRHCLSYQSDTDLEAKMTEYEVISIEKIQTYKLDTILKQLCFLQEIKLGHSTSTPQHYLGPPKPGIEHQTGILLSLQPCLSLGSWRRWCQTGT